MMSRCSYADGFEVEAAGSVGAEVDKFKGDIPLGPFKFKLDPPSAPKPPKEPEYVVELLVI